VERLSTLAMMFRIHWLIFAVTLGFASVVEWAHFRRFQRKKDPIRMATTAIAAIAAGYMASEALERDWPSWRGFGYSD
jgi:hypothetical protein